MKNKTIKIFPFIVFFLLVFNVSANKAQALCWTSADCPTCQGCIIFCKNATSDTRCSTMCENGNCAKQCTGTCKNACDENNYEVEGLSSNGKCYAGGQLSGQKCCVHNTTENCDGECLLECNEDSYTEISGECFDGKRCCLPALIPKEVTLNYDFELDQDAIDDSITDSLNDMYDEVTPLESGSNPTKNVLFTGISCINSGNCSVNDMMLVGINLTRFLLGIIGSVALFFFMFAGFKMLTSRGNEKDITSAKQMMVQTIIGILVFLSAYLIVDFIQKGLLKNPVNLSALPDEYKATDMCSKEHPGWTCKNYCGGNNYDYCKQFIDVGASSTPKCEYNLCGANNTNVCCE